MGRVRVRVADASRGAESPIRGVGVEMRARRDASGVGDVDVRGGGDRVDVRGDGGALVGVRGEPTAPSGGVLVVVVGVEVPRGVFAGRAGHGTDRAKVRRDVVAETALAAPAHADEEDGGGEMVVHAQGFDQQARGVADAVTRGERGGAVRRARPRGGPRGCRDRHERRGADRRREDAQRGEPARARITGGGVHRVRILEQRRTLVEKRVPLPTVPHAWPGCAADELRPRASDLCNTHQQRQLVVSFEVASSG